MMRPNSDNWAFTSKSLHRGQRPSRTVWLERMSTFGDWKISNKSLKSSPSQHLNSLKDIKSNSTHVIPVTLWSMRFSFYFFTSDLLAIKKRWRWVIIIIEEMLMWERNACPSSGHYSSLLCLGININIATPQLPFLLFPGIILQWLRST